MTRCFLFACSRIKEDNRVDDSVNFPWHVTRSARLQGQKSLPEALVSFDSGPPVSFFLR